MCRVVPAPDVDLAGHLLHHSVLEGLVGAVVALLERVATLFEGAVERFHRLWLCKVVPERELHGAEVGPAGLGAGGLGAAVVVVDAARCPRGPAQLLVAVQLLRQVGQVGGHLLVPQGEQLVVRGVEHLLKARFIESGFASHDLLPRLLHLYQDGNDEEDQDDARRDADNCAVGFSDLFEEPRRFLLCRKRREAVRRRDRERSCRASVSCLQAQPDTRVAGATENGLTSGFRTKT